MKQKKTQKNNKALIYQAKDGAIELRGDFANETVWATQAQIAELFGSERSVVTKHIRNILNDKELEEKSVCANFAHTAQDGKTYQVRFYSLDVILSVGYRTNSKRAIEFRQWATKTLRSYIVDGFVVNKKRIAANYERFLHVVEEVKRLLPPGVVIEPKDAVELISTFADTWLSLEAYDRDALRKTGASTAGGANKKSTTLDEKQFAASLAELKSVLISRSQATDLFATEKHPGSVSGIVGNIKQSFGGKELYESAEEKAAHLLYFMVKNHPFNDGNKRSGAFAFVWYLKQANILNLAKITPSALTALTILVASSDPSEKEKVISLILHLIGGGK